jgi:hypothetical protein
MPDPVKINFKVRDTLQNFFENNLQFNPRKQCTETAMTANTECKMSIRPSIENNLVRIFELFGVSICGRPEHIDFLTCAYFLAADLRIRSHISGERVNGSLKTQKLIDGTWNQ